MCLPGCFGFKRLRIMEGLVALRKASFNGGTLARDRVRYAVPFDWLVHGWLVRPDIEKIFQHRSEMLKRRFAESHPVPS